MACFQNEQGQETYSVWLEGRRECCVGRSFIGVVASKASEKLVRLSFLNNENGSNRVEGFVLLKVREGRRKEIWEILNEGVARA